MSYYWKFRNRAQTKKSYCYLTHCVSLRLLPCCVPNQEVRPSIVWASQASDFCVPWSWSYQHHKVTFNKLTSVFHASVQFLIVAFVILSKQLLIHVVNVVIAEWIHRLLWQCYDEIHCQKRRDTWKTEVHFSVGSRNPDAIKVGNHSEDEVMKMWCYSGLIKKKLL